MPAVRIRMTRSQLHAWQTIIWIAGFVLWVAFTLSIVDWWADDLLKIGTWPAIARITAVCVWWLLTVIYVRTKANERIEEQDNGTGHLPQQ